MSYTTEYDDAIKAAMTRWFPQVHWLWGKAQLCQESGLDPNARNPTSGALGLGQFMPATWDQVSKQYGFPEAVPTDPTYAIPAHARYMRDLWDLWHSQPRTPNDRLRLAQASYDAGAGNIIHAQRLAGGALDYDSIIQKLPLVTGARSAETIDYTKKIASICWKLNQPVQ